MLTVEAAHRNSLSFDEVYERAIAAALFLQEWGPSQKPKETDCSTLVPDYAPPAIIASTNESLIPAPFRPLHRRISRGI